MVRFRMHCARSVIFGKFPIITVLIFTNKVITDGSSLERQSTVERLLTARIAARFVMPRPALSFRALMLLCSGAQHQVIVHP